MLRKSFLLSLAIAGLALTLASVAWACTTVQGSTTLSATSGAAGSTLTATGDNALANHSGWTIHFLNYKSTQDTMFTCMGTAPGGAPVGDQDISSPPGTTYGSTNTGHIPALGTATGKIPPKAQKTLTPLDPALICFVDSGYNNATNAASFTVLGS